MQRGRGQGFCLDLRCGDAGWAFALLAAGFCCRGSRGARVRLTLRWHPPHVACFTRRGSVCLPFRWHPRVVSVLQASPLCGAAPTFLCRRKEK
ncbi:hypothetical protein BCAR13_180042 [Paraburkholderia caribensis]|nr:hypothetical protein BCAR13_180042 [Paraburkholderia caribensis]